jgi:hypothetical protein
MDVFAVTVCPFAMVTVSPATGTTPPAQVPVDAQFPLAPLEIAVALAEIEIRRKRKILMALLLDGEPHPCQIRFRR